MVTVSNYKLVTTNEGESYIRLILTGDISMVKSETTGNFYATTRRCSISATFDEATAKLMVGKSMPGSIIKEDCEPYLYELDGGETLELKHRWVYTEKTSEDLAIDHLVSSVNSNGNGTSKELNAA